MRAAAAFSSLHRPYVERVLAACQADQRIAAALLVGSYAEGRSDEHSDLDLYVIIVPDELEAFLADRAAFARMLGQPVFEEDFGHPNLLMLIYSDGAEVELHFAGESELPNLLDAPFQVLMDKRGIAAELAVPVREPDLEAQRRKLQRLIGVFWHDFSHFATAMARGQLWWARGQLEVLRSLCVGLARLRHDFTDPEVEEDVYFKLENTLPVERLSPLKATFVPLEREAMLRAAQILLDFYREVAAGLAEQHGLTYPAELEQVVKARLGARTL